ncbi:MAG: tRNA (adenosine(37)-N6)-dimethylallyltransferase MiaA [Deltaproteobacteria bacterium]|jgi:tRNA dimethylallyltransferase|nr:tRNA (adenosine(37)-N6)-dimethylallyltransferase MiaA [Deltaproteobacteria bacterium]MBW2530897.1 tRNA (adenosine(37)-N6)-dimethylallyltransferase MiaA [Deltaproteobacteria bacterium]
MSAGDETSPSVSGAQDGPLIAVVGPTASGKTELAIRLAEQRGGEIVSADSIQIYRHFDIGSGKPTPSERRRVPHHLVDCVEPNEPIDAARFVELADRAIERVRSRGKEPILCGGTFLWTKALLFGLAPSAPADEATRRRHRELVERDGNTALYRQLAEVDPARAAQLSPNDVVRVSRALEVFELTGRPQTEWHAEHGFRQARYDAQLVGVQRSREELDRRIEERTRGWLEGGWIEEVRGLMDAGYGDARAMASVGYRQVRDHLEGELDRADLATAVVRATRTLVRRQRTWLRDQRIRWIAPDASVDDEQLW